MSLQTQVFNVLLSQQGRKWTILEIADQLNISPIALVNQIDYLVKFQMIGKYNENSTDQTTYYI